MALDVPTGNDESGNTRRTFLRTVGVSSLAASSTILAGCSQSDETTPTSDGSDGGGTGSDSTQTDGGDGTNIQRGGDLNIAVQANIVGIPGTLHTHVTQGGVAMTNKVSFLWANRLVRYNDDAELVPKLASDWEYANDGQDLVLTLREDVTFHDGSEFNADDVVYSFVNSILRTDIPTDLREFYAGGMLVGGDSGVTAEDAVEKTGEYEVTFHPPQFNSSLLSSFAQQGAYIIPDGAYDSVDNPRDWGQLPDPGPIGTGPFQYESSTAQNEVRFTKFDDYWEEGEGGQLPYLDTVTMQISQDPQPRYSSLTTGQADIASFLPLNRMSNLESQDGVEPLLLPGPRLQRFVFNHTYWEPASSPTFKQGIAYAIDKPAINEAIRSGYGEINHAHIPSWHRLYDAVSGDITEYEQDMDRAQELINESGYTPEEVGQWNAVTEQEEEDAQTALTIVQQQLEELGFDVNPNPLLRPEGYEAWEWHSSAENPTDPPEDQHTNLFARDSESPDPNLWLGPQNWARGARTNRCHYVGVSDMANTAATIEDEEERNQMWQDILTKINNDVPEVSMVWFPVAWGKQSNVRNLTVSPFQEYDLTGVWLEQ